MASTTGKAGFIIEEVAGCGRFQTIITFLVFFVGKAPANFSMCLLIFSIYNPGWRCLDESVPETFSSSFLVHNTSSSASPSSPHRGHRVGHNNHFQEDIQNVQLGNQSGGGHDMDFGGDLVFDNCTLYYSCQNVQFDPETSTLVSEWGLVCDKAWVGPLIASLYYSGVIAGSFFVGQLGDTIGRKKTFYGAFVVTAVLNLASFFSTSWQMLAVLWFFVGMANCANVNLAYVYAAEFATLKWRGRIPTLPVTAVTAIICGLTLMALKNWRHMVIVTVVLSVITFIPVLWVPESLRWLEVKQKSREFISVAKKVTKTNGKSLPHNMDVLMSVHSEDLDSSSVQKKRKAYVLLDLFRRGYKLQTLVIAFENISCNAWYFTINYGIQTLYGNFYTNFMLVNIIEIPSGVIAMVISNALGRKSIKLIYLGVVIASFTAACCFKLSPWIGLKTSGVSVVVLVGKASVMGYWCFVETQTAELYPTVVRSIALNWGGLFGRIGGAIAPFLVPSDPSSMFITYAAMAGWGLVCSVAVLNLVETKGKPLKETFDDAGAEVIIGQHDEDADDLI